MRLTVPGGVVRVLQVGGERVPDSHSLRLQTAVPGAAVDERGAAPHTVGRRLF